MLPKLIQVAAISLMCIAAAVGYGIIHDLVTAHVCVEYFSVGHPRVIASESPTALALVWGVIATWWAGLILGIPLGFAAQLGRRPALNAGTLRPMVLRLLCIMALCAALAGLVGFVLARRGDIELISDLAERVPQNHHIAFLAVGAAHLASYAVGFLGGFILILIVIFRRRRLSQET